MLINLKTTSRSERCVDIKNIILSADGTMRVYSVPDKIADNLEGTCWYFRSIWIYDGPESSRLTKKDATWFNEKDFIDYLNNWETPEYHSVLVEELSGNEIPEKYKNCPRYDF